MYKNGFNTFLIILTLFFVACSTPLKDNKSENQTATNSNNTTGSTSQIGMGEVVSDPLHNPKSILADRSIYFAFDNYTVDAEYNPLITAHAEYLGNNLNQKVIVEGNTDERGSREYNLALGQRRAEAVIKALLASGAKSSQLEAISFGKEKPRALGNDETAWAENRRADIVYN